MRDCFCQIAHRLVTFLKQPIGQATHLQGNLPQCACGYSALGLAARQEVHSPSGVLSGRMFKVMPQSLHLVQS